MAAMSKTSKYFRWVHFDSRYRKTVRNWPQKSIFDVDDVTAWRQSRMDTGDGHRFSLIVKKAVHAILLIFKQVKHQYNLQYFSNHYHHYNEHYISKFWQVRNLRLPFHLSVCLSVDNIVFGVCFGISISNFMCMFIVAIGRKAHCFSATSVSKWPPGGHIGFLAATKQLYKWYFPSVCLSVTPFWLCSHHGIIIKFSGVITNDQSKVHAKGQGQRSRSQRSQPNLAVSGL